MSLTNLNSKDLKEIAKLLQRKEKLKAEIEAIDSELRAFETGSKPRGRKKTSIGSQIASAMGKGTRGPRGKTKDKIIEALKEAGSDGLKVEQVAEKCGLATTSVRTWLYNTGKKTPGIENISRGVFAYVEPQAKATSPKKEGNGKKAKNGD